MPKILLFVLFLALFSCAAYEMSPSENGDKLQYIQTPYGRTWIEKQHQIALPHLIFIHGKLGSTEDLFHSPPFADIQSAFSVTAYDRPGSGRSLNRSPDGVWSPEQFADHLYFLVKKLNISRPVLLAHSWGGAIALAYALKYPEELSGMVLLAPAANPWPGFLPVSPLAHFMATPLLGDAFLYTIFPPLARALAPLAVPPVFAPAPVPEIYKGYSLDLALSPRANQLAERDSIYLRTALEQQAPRYSEITAPTHIITDPADTIVPPKIHARPLCKTLQNCTLIESSNAGHHPLFSDKGEIMRALRSITRGDQKRVTAQVPIHQPEVSIHAQSSHHHQH